MSVFIDVALEVLLCVCLGVGVEGGKGGLFNFVVEDGVKVVVCLYDCVVGYWVLFLKLLVRLDVDVVVVVCDELLPCSDCGSIASVEGVVYSQSSHFEWEVDLLALCRCKNRVG